MAKRVETVYIVNRDDVVEKTDCIASTIFFLELDKAEKFANEYQAMKDSRNCKQSSHTDKSRPPRISYYVMDLDISNEEANLYLLENNEAIINYENHRQMILENLESIDGNKLTDTSFHEVLDSVLDKEAELMYSDFYQAITPSLSRVELTNNWSCLSNDIKHYWRNVAKRSLLRAILRNFKWRESNERTI